nr:MAG TPA: Terminase large subunit [Caudoviricetes sp.]
MSIPHTLEGELLRRKLRKDYSAYCEYVNRGFYMSHFHKWLCDKVQEFLETPCTNGVMDILLLSVPPQHGKSTTVTETLPSWFLAKHPEDAVIIAGYEGTFAEGFSRRNRDKFNEYAEDIFGVKPNPNVQGVALWETELGGKCRAAGLKAGITGYPAELFIIDDPIKNKEQAQSDTMLAKIHDEMAPSVQTRIHPGGKLIVIQTRWVENDCIGWIQEHWHDYIWADINIPCECEDAATDPLGRQPGEAIMGEHMGDLDLPQKIRKDNTWLKGAKQLVIAADGTYTWNALYQGHPTAENGNLFAKDSWQYYRLADLGDNLSTRVPERAQFDYLQLSVDATFKQTETSDKVAIELWGIRDNDAWLVRLVNKRMGFTATVSKIQQILKEWPGIDELVIEDKANGSAIIDTLQYTEGVPPIVGVNPLGGKFSRAQAVSPFVAARRCHIRTDWTLQEAQDIEPSGRILRQPHEEFIEQLAHFPYAKNDDMVDACSQALARIIKLLTGEEPMPQRKILKFVKWYPDMWEDYENMSDVEQQRFIDTYGAPLEWREYYT